MGGAWREGERHTDKTSDHTSQCVIVNHTKCHPGERVLNLAFTVIFLNKNILPLFNKDLIDKQILPSPEKLGDMAAQSSPVWPLQLQVWALPSLLWTPVLPPQPLPASFPGVHPCNRLGSSSAVPVLKFLIILEHGAP